MGTPGTADRAAALAKVEEAFIGFASRSTLTRLRERIAAQAGGVIDPAGYPMLGRIRAWGPLRITDLAERVGLDVSTASRRVGDLERAGLVKHVADPDDRRAHLLEVTPKGKRTLARFREAHHALLDEALTEWSPEEIRALADVLARFTSALTNVV
ncbi:MAG TPA: MarR family winged helix-turn-helix transcriptional regulator [Actinomycetota bacterium]